jgi:hypothetical protein
MDRRLAEGLADEIDLRALPACPMCLFDLAWAMREGEQIQPGLVARTCDWVSLEITDSLRAALVETRMREVDGAEAALADLAERGWRSTIVRVVVERLARMLADDMRAFEAFRRELG